MTNSYIVEFDGVNRTFCKDEGELCDLLQHISKEQLSKLSHIDIIKNTVDWKALVVKNPKLEVGGEN